MTTVWPVWGTATPTRSTRSASAGPTFEGRTAADLRAGDRGARDRPRGLVPRHGRAGLGLRAAADEARPRRQGRAGRTRPARRDRPRPRLSRRSIAAAALRPRGRPTMKIGLVCPYIYPGTGGVAQHVRFLYENLRLRGHDVRILTASHGPQRSSEGDIIRLGVGFSVPINASVGTLTFSPRYLSQIGAMLERERFDVLHFHEPFVPFLSLFLLRESTSVNVATFHAYAGFSPSYEFGSRALRGPRRAVARPDRGHRRGAALHRPLLPGRLQGHPQRRRRRPLRQRGPDRALAGRHREHPVRRALRAAQGSPGPAQGAPDPAQDGVELPAAGGRLRPAGAGGPALRRDTRPAGCRVPRARLGRRQGAALPHRRRVRVTGHRRRIVRDRPARGDGRRHPHRVLGYPRVQGRGPARPRGPAGPAARPARARGRHSTS